MAVTPAQLGITGQQALQQYGYSPQTGNYNQPLTAAQLAQLNSFIGAATAAPTTQTRAGQAAAGNVSPFSPTVPVNQFLYQQQLEMANQALGYLQADRTGRIGQLTQDYNRYVALTDEDKALNIEQTNVAYALAKEKALAGYYGRNVGDSGIKAEGQQEMNTEQGDTIAGFERAAKRAKAEQSIQFNRAKSEIETAYNRSVQSVKQSLAGSAPKLLTAYNN